MGNLFVISGPSGVGKGSIIKKILANNKIPNLYYSISITTRLPRINEKDGVNYFFVSLEKFKNMLKNDEFLEYAIVYGNQYYGTSKKIVQNKLKEGYNVILEIDTQGALKIKNKNIKGIFIMILPPSLQILEHRIQGRKTETKEQIAERLAKAKKEIAQKFIYDYEIINDDLNLATTKLENIFLKEIKKCI